MLSLETIKQETIWVGKFYEGGRISGTWREKIWMGGGKVNAR